MTGQQVTISAKVPRRLKEELEKKGVKLSEAIRRGLEAELIPYCHTFRFEGGCLR